MATPSESQREKNSLSNNEDVEMNSADVMRILVATDNHLGYMERDRIRRDDSFITMEEIMKVAIEKDVDFIIHGGDLFHENKPSRETLHKTIELLRKYCCGDKPVPLVINSDQKMNFKANLGTVNYEDPNFNISLPIFAIHGNHDDPTGEIGLSALDLLSMANLVNYYGKSENIDDIHVKPILISKGETKLALYGLGHIRDERLYRTFEQKKVKFYRPTASKNEWFNIFVTHQNRNQHHTKKSSMSDSFLRGFFDLVIWGHEHEQLVIPERSSEGFDVIQPGSSVVTSLSPEEAKQKKIAVLEIYKDQYRCIPVDLKTVRPFVMNSIALKDFPELDDERNNADEIADFLAGKIEELIEEAKERIPPKEVLKEYPGLKLPLVRLKVDYSGGYATINPQRFGQRFVDKVANPSELLILSRTKTRKTTKAKDTETNKDDLLNAIVGSRTDSDDFLSAVGTAASEGISIDDLVGQFLKQGAQKLGLMNEIQLQDAVLDFVDKEEANAINDFVQKQLKDVQKKLWSDTKDLEDNLDEEDIVNLVEKYAAQERASVELRQDKRRAGRANKKLTESDKPQDDDETDNEAEDFMPVKKEKEEEQPKKGRGKSTTTKGRGRGKKTTTSTRKKKVDSEDEYEEEEAPKKRRTRSTATTKKTATKKRSRSPSPEPEEEADYLDEEDEPPKKKRTTTTKKASTSKNTKAKSKFKAIELSDDE